MFAELSTSTLSAMSPSCSLLEFTTSNNNHNSPVRVMDFCSEKHGKTAMVVIPKCLLPEMSLASALAKGAALTNDQEATFSCTEDDGSISELSMDEGVSPLPRRAIFSPYWEKSGEQPLELVPTGAPEKEEVAIVRSSAASVQSWPGTYEQQIQELSQQRAPMKPRLVHSDTSLVRKVPPSILRKPKYSGKRNSAPPCATSLAIAGALATIGDDGTSSPRVVKFNATVDVRVFSKERPMEEPAQPGWSKLFAS